MSAGKSIAQDLVVAFHHKFNLPHAAEPITESEVDWGRMAQRWEWLREELFEMADAIANKDLGAMADALVDMDYFNKGTFVELGINERPLFLAVHAANMQKVKLPGVTKIAKPEGWKHPDISALIDKQRNR